MGHSRVPLSGGQYGGGGAGGNKPNLADTRSGPRIFVGKLNKETSEADVKASPRALNTSTPACLLLKLPPGRPCAVHYTPAADGLQLQPDPVVTALCMC